MPLSRASRFRITAPTPPESWRRSRRASRRDCLVAEVAEVAEVAGAAHFPAGAAAAPGRKFEKSEQRGVTMADMHVGFEETSKYPLFEALHKRRSRRISLGI